MTGKEILESLIECRNALESRARRLKTTADGMDVGDKWKATHDHSNALWDVFESVDESVRRLRDALEALP